MTCLECGSQESFVHDTRRRAGGWLYRRRECVSCGARYSTKEELLATGAGAPEVTEEALIEEVRWFLSERLKEIRKEAKP